MKPYKYLFLPLLILPLATSCGKEEPLDGPVSLNPNVAGVSLTRGGINDVTAIDAIGFYLVDKDDQKANNAYGTWPQGTYGKYLRQNNNTFNPADEQQTLWLTSGKTATVFSCYPAPENGTSIVDASTLKEDGTTADPPVTPSTAVPVIPVASAAINLSPSLPSDNKTDFALAQYDYMYGVACSKAGEKVTFEKRQPFASGDHTSVVNQSGPIVSVGLNHAFAQIRLVIKKGDYPGKVMIEKVSYTRQMPTLTANTKMKLTDGTFLGLSEESEQSYVYTLTSGSNPSGLEITSGDNAKDLTIVNYALPCSQSGSTINVKASGKEMSITYGDDPAWQPGKIYTYGITVNGTGLSFSGVSVVSWATSENNNSSGTL